MKRIIISATLMCFILGCKTNKSDLIGSYRTGYVIGDCNIHPDTCYYFTEKLDVTNETIGLSYLISKSCMQSDCDSENEVYMKILFKNWYMVGDTLFSENVKKIDKREHAQGFIKYSKGDSLTKKIKSPNFGSIIHGKKWLFFPNKKLSIGYDTFKKE